MRFEELHKCIFDEFLHNLAEIDKIIVDNFHRLYRHFYLIFMWIVDNLKKRLPLQEAVLHTFHYLFLG